jgi:hypothetical protein
MPESPQPLPKEGPVTDDKDERMWASFCHLSAFAGLVVPLGNILGPLVVWLMKKDVYPLVDDQGKEALNFQINIIIFVVVAVLSLFCFVGFVLLPAVGIFAIVMTIIATLRANQGIRYRYPLTIRFLH